MKLAKILEHILNYYKVEVLLKTSTKVSKLAIYNQIRSLAGVTVMNIIHSDFLDTKRTNIYEYSLVTLKFLTKVKPDAELDLIKKIALSGETRIEGLFQFVPRFKTLSKINLLR